MGRSIKAPNFIEFLNKIPHGKKQIIFPNVTKLTYKGAGYNVADFSGSFDLNEIFPKLESLTLYYNMVFIHYSEMRVDMNCLKNIKNLKELQLEISPNSTQVDELDNFFASNPKISKIKVTIKDNFDVLHSIANRLKNVQTLEIQFDSSEYLDHIPGDLSFNMPKLNVLTKG